jgi:hypothetical protein
LKIIHEDCDPSLADDKSLPTSSFLVEYVIGKDIHYDIVMAAKQVEIFDYYWDKYREDLLTFNQTQGRISPKLWGYKAPEGKKKKKDD